MNCIFALNVDRNMSNTLISRFSDCSDIQLYISSLESRLGYFRLLDIRSGKNINDCINQCLNMNGCWATYYSNKCLLLSRLEKWVDMILEDIRHTLVSASMVEMKCYTGNAYLKKLCFYYYMFFFKGFA